MFTNTEIFKIYFNSLNKSGDIFINYQTTVIQIVHSAYITKYECTYNRYDNITFIY